MESLKRISLKSEETNFEKVKISSAETTANFIRGFYFDDINIFESCFLLLLDNSMTTIGYAKLSQGGICGTVVDVRILAKYAIESLCTGVVLAHNHPSGNLKPSEADNIITNKVKQALKLFDIVLIDHLIITSTSYYSYANEGTL